MIPTRCMVQAGQIADSTEAQLREDMKAFAEKSFGSEPFIQWVVVPENSGFTAAKPSTSVIVQMMSNRPLKTPERIEMLKELCDIWIERTGKSMNEVVCAVADPFVQDAA